MNGEQSESPMTVLQAEHQIILRVVRVLARLMDRFEQAGEFAESPLAKCVEFIRLFSVENEIKRMPILMLHSRCVGCFLPSRSGSDPDCSTGRSQNHWAAGDDPFGIDAGIDMQSAARNHHLHSLQHGIVRKQACGGG